MKNITKILMVALLVIVATVSVSAAKVDLSLVEDDDFYNLQAVVAEIDNYTNTFDVKFTFDNTKLALYDLDEDAEFDIADIEDYAEYAFEMVKTSKKKFNISKIITEVEGDYVTIQIVANAPDLETAEVFPKKDFNVWNMAVVPKVDVESLTAADFSVEFIMVADIADTTYGYNYSEATDGEVTLSGNVIFDGEEEEEVVIENKDTVVELGCPVFSVNFSTIEADKYGFVGTVRNNEKGVDGDFTLADGDKVVYAEILSKDFEADKDARAWVKGVEAGATIAVRAYYVFGDDVVYGEIMEFTFEG